MLEFIDPEFSDSGEPTERYYEQMVSVVKEVLKIYILPKKGAADLKIRIIESMIAEMGKEDVINIYLWIGKIMCQLHDILEIVAPTHPFREARYGDVDIDNPFSSN